MALRRTVLMTWLLAMLSLNTNSATVSTSATVSEITAVVGESVTMPFPCSNTTAEIVWQNNGKIVSHYHTSRSAKISEPDDSYKHRSRLQLDFNTMTCSLILLRVNELDQNFTCFTFDKSNSILDFKFHLTHGKKRKDGPTPSSPRSYMKETVSVGIAVILAAGLILGILLMRRRRRIQRRETHLDSKAEVPIIERSPV